MRLAPNKCEPTGVIGRSKGSGGRSWDTVLGFLGLVSSLENYIHQLFLTNQLRSECELAFFDAAVRNLDHPEQTRPLILFLMQKKACTQRDFVR